VGWQVLKERSFQEDHAMSITRRIANLFRRSDVNRDIEDELQAHIALRADDNRAAGMSPAEAHRDARLRFGNPVSTRERAAAADAALTLETLARDARYILRRIRRSPGFAVTAIVTLALGIAANVVVFSVLNAILLRPLKVANPTQLYQVVHSQSGYDSQSYPDYVDFKTRNTAFTDLAA
jgi:hypothetical protein